MDITKFGLKNFRIFKEHFDFELAPIMVLTGPNNSGKSSLSKALLLLKENEELINMDSHGPTRLNYLGGEHNLGNHKYVVNKEGENSLFTFTFFLDYKFCVEINDKAEYIYDYKINTANNELVISQLSGEININVQNLIQYFNDRLSFDINNNQILGEDVEPETISKINVKKIEEFIQHLIEFGDEIDVININLWDAFYYSQEKIEDKINLFDENLKKRIFSPFLNLESEIVHFNEDILDLDWSICLIYIFHIITNIRLNEDEIIALIPMAQSNFFSFLEIVYVHTMNEPLKRAYTKEDNLIFQSIIRNEIIKKRYEDYSVDYNVNINVTNKQKETFFKANLFNKTYEEVIEKWLREFEIGEELSYGYNEDNDIYFIKIDNKSLLEYGLGFGLIIHILLALSKEADSFLRKGTSKKLNFPVTYIIEEPETGLHPAFQSKMAEMLVDIQKIFKVNLIIETHSEYLIRKLQYLTATKEFKPGDAVIYYFNNPKKVREGEEQIKKITIDENGSLSDHFGPGFIDEGTNVKFELLRYNKSRNN